jgi:carboxyl-terminal processing protease
MIGVNTMSTQTESFSLEIRRQLLDNVAAVVSNRLFDPRFNGHDWNGLVHSRRERILGAEQPDGFIFEVLDLLSQLGVKPVHFFHQSGATVPFQRAAWATLFAADQHWVFQDVHLDGPAFNAGIEPGDILRAVNQVSVVPPLAVELPAAAPITLTVEKRGGQQVAVNLQRVPSIKAGPQPTRFVSCSQLADHVGYIRVSRFPGLVGVDLAKDIDRAFRQLGDCERLIVDLRGNPGGGTANLRLMSYFTPDRVPVGYSLTRQRVARGYKREELPQFRHIPSSKLALIWLALRFKFADKSIVVVTEGLGRKNFHGNIVLLVNQHTTSGSEIVAGFAREHRLATIVGQQTAGRLFGWSTFRLEHGYRLVLPVSNYLTWEGKCFEGEGIRPDVEVVFSPEAAREGRDNQLEQAILIAKSLATDPARMG